MLLFEGRTLFGVHLQLTHITLSVDTSLLQIHVWNILVLRMYVHVFSCRPPGCRPQFNEWSPVIPETSLFRVLLPPGCKYLWDCVDQGAAWVTVNIYLQAAASAADLQNLGT